MGQSQASEAKAFSLYPPADLSRYIAPEHWAIYSEVMSHADADEIPFAVGGGLAVCLYTGLWRATKDIDLYVLPEDREALIAATQTAGLVDYYDQVPYDRKWIYRAAGSGVIVDVIWALANGFGEVDAGWLRRGPCAQVQQRSFTLLAPAEMIRTKLHVLQRDRCDWPDLLNLLYTTGPALDWDRVIGSFPGEERLLAALVMVFSWLAPGRAAQLPDRVWSRLRLEPPPPMPVLDELRVQRLDTRPWFTDVRPQ
ncbi:MAG TPA: hypothetical protein VFA81_06310 [Burkholderiales bacterium]|nr:hypothetical protein [Burkholderiales bacterium]